MNKKEGIGKYKVGQQVAICGFIEEINIENLRDIENTTHLVINTLTRTIDVNPKYETVITDLNKPKPVVPQYVADWYEDIKEDFENKLFDYIRNFHIYKSSSESKDFNFWFDDNENAIQTLVNMYQFGYEVKKEKLYTVEIPNPNLKTHTILQKVGEGLVLIMVTNARWRGWAESKLTEAEIKQDFDWAWKWAKEVEE